MRSSAVSPDPADSYLPRRACVQPLASPSDWANGTRRLPRSGPTWQFAPRPTSRIKPTCRMPARPWRVSRRRATGVNARGSHISLAGDEHCAERVESLRPFLLEPLTAHAVGKLGVLNCD